MDGHAALGERKRDPAGADTELERGAIAGQLREERHDRLYDGRVRLMRRTARRSVRPRSRRSDPQPSDAPRLGVDVERAVADEAAERDPAVGCELDGERRRRADGDEQRAAGDGRLLDELEREAAADAEERAGERQQPVEERAADDLVERVVAADVLAHAEQLAVGGEEPGRVQPAGRLECRLCLAEPVGELSDQRRLDPKVALDPRRLDRHGVERALAADAARGRGVEAALQPARRRHRGRRRRRCWRRDRRARAPRAAAVPPRGRSRARALRRAPASASSPPRDVPPSRISSGSSTATRSPASPPGTRVTCTRDVLCAGAFTRKTVQRRFSRQLASQLLGNDGVSRRLRNRASRPPGPRAGAARARRSAGGRSRRSSPSTRSRTPRADEIATAAPDRAALEALEALEAELLERERALAAREASLAGRAGALLAAAQALYDEVLGGGPSPNADELARLRRRRSLA